MYENVTYELLLERMLGRVSDKSLYTLSSKSWYSGYWNTRPTLKRTSRMRLGSAQMSRPSRVIVPPVGSRKNWPGLWGYDGFVHDAQRIASRLQ